MPEYASIQTRTYRLLFVAGVVAPMQLPVIFLGGEMDVYASCAATYELPAWYRWMSSTMLLLTRALG